MREIERRCRHTPEVTAALIFGVTEKESELVCVIRNVAMGAG
jgi:hypothetical protein